MISAFVSYRSFIHRNPKTGSILDAIIWLSCFYATGIAFYSNVEGWTWLQSAFFLTVTMSTVGYGDLSPSTWYSRAVTLLVILVGIVGVFNHVGDASEKLISPLIYRATQIIKRYVPDKQKISFQSDDLHQQDCLIPRSALIYYGTNLFAGFMLVLLIQLLFAAFFIVAISNGGPDAPVPNYGLMVYHCYVTMTTVGYGDVSVGWSNQMMTIAIVQILVSVSLVTSLIADFKQLGIRRHSDFERLHQLTRRLDPEYIRMLAESSHSAHAALGSTASSCDKRRPDDEEAHWSLSRFDFVLGTLVLTKVLSWDVVEPIIEQFDRIDIDGSGRIGPSELKAHEEQMTKAGLHRALSKTALLLGIPDNNRATRGGRAQRALQELFLSTKRAKEKRASGRTRRRTRVNHGGRGTQLQALGRDATTSVRTAAALLIQTRIRGGKTKGPDQKSNEKVIEKEVTPKALPRRVHEIAITISEKGSASSTAA